MLKKSSPLSGLVKAISLTLKQIRLYSAVHPITKQSMISLDEEINNFFDKEKKLSLGTMKHLLVANGTITGEKDPAARDLAKELERLHVDAITIQKGINVNELSALLGMMAMRGKSLDEKGGFDKVFENAKLAHVKLSTGTFQLVEEGQAVAAEEALGGVGSEEEGDLDSPGESPSRPIRSIVDIIQRLRTEGKGGPGESAEALSNIHVDCEKVVVQLEKNPTEIAKQAIGETKDPAELENVIRKIVDFLIKTLIGFLVEQGKDITKALHRLSKELEKNLKSVLGDNEQLEVIQKRIPAIFEEATDDLRVQMMVKTFENNPEDMKAIEKMAKKLFKDEATRKRLAPSLNEDLIRAGLKAGSLEAIFQKMEERAGKKKSRVTVDTDELQALRVKAAHYDAGEGGSSLVAEVKKLKREKKVIQDEKERVDTVIRNLAEGLLVVDKSGKVVLMNPAAEKLLGVQQKEKLGKNIAEGLREEHMVAMTNGNLRDSDGNVAKNVELMSINDETKRVLQASTAVVENEDGETVGMVSVLSDVTRQKEVEDLKTNFVSNVSHELRTPLVAIQKSLTLILDEEVGAVSEEQGKFLNIAHRNIDRLSRLINDLLDVSKLEAGGLSLKAKKVPIKELILHVCSTMETWSKDKKIKLIPEFADENLILEADPDKLTQVLTNLVGNAMKFTPDGGCITIDVKAGIKDPDLFGVECAEIGVRDTGIGISPEDQKKIFNKFEQVSLAQPAGFSSTGLGLTISKEIVELHSGKIWVESDPGKGSRFVFRIPVNFKLNQIKKQKLL